MRLSAFRIAVAFASTPLLGASLMFSGCSQGHPDDRMAVYNTLDQHDLRSLTVSQDRHAGTLTLSGIVGSNDNKQKAEQLAQRAAPGYSIINRIQVENTGLQSDIQAAQKDAKLDSAIEKHYNATLAAHGALKDVHASAYNQTLTLKGSVDTYKEREEAEDLAKKVPQVQHVVNEIQLKNGKSGPSNS